MENHLHFIVSSATLSRAVGQFKSFTARSIIDWLIQHQFHSILKQLKAGKAVYKSDQKYQLWQEGSHPQAIFSPDVFRQKLEYIHNNPIRRGYVDEPGHWRYSSYRNYMGEEGLLSVQLLDV
ncbi:transposase [Phormidium sp. CCY1219]|uniref:transposase n=1 Tax=Phormidium sp. CCY1219 TaxID=2886104 RepID=UPI002D1F4407|nr:transposase [Phormidium sp. CCY1219]MEB3825870.1 transposase [Phormidium sp. CCY1219]